MYSHEDKDKFATKITLIAAVPFGILFILALICICASL
jgi:hypothetical protein